MTYQAGTETVQPSIDAISTATALRRRLFLRHATLGMALLVTAGAGAYFSNEYWTVGRFLVSTDDAYIAADSTTVAPKVSGYIARVLVNDNEQVKAGQVLARIDDSDFRASLKQAYADVAASEAEIGNIDAQTSLQQAEIAQARAAVFGSRAALLFARSDAERYRYLARTGDGTVQRAQLTESTMLQQSSRLQGNDAELIAATRRITVLQTARAQAMAAADRSRAIAHQAELNLGYTVIEAPVDGVVGARSLRVGQYVAAGTQLMAIVPLQAVYVVANFKETQLAHVRSGQPVTLTVDGLPGIRIKAHVDSLSPASGLEFALLPPDNATGNFTKIVQRVPVKISLDDHHFDGLLRAGMSVEPTIDTRRPAVGRHYSL